MSSRIIAEFHVEPEKLSEFKEVMKVALVDTRSFNGFIKLEIVEDVEKHFAVAALDDDEPPVLAQARAHREEELLLLVGGHEVEYVAHEDEVHETVHAE